MRTHQYIIYVLNDKESRNTFVQNFTVLHKRVMHARVTSNSYFFSQLFAIHRYSRDIRIIKKKNMKFLMRFRCFFYLSRLYRFFFRDNEILILIFNLWAVYRRDDGWDISYHIFLYRAYTILGSQQWIRGNITANPWWDRSNFLRFQFVLSTISNWPKIIENKSKEDLCYITSTRIYIFFFNSLSRCKRCFIDLSIFFSP